MQALRVKLVGLAEADEAVLDLSLNAFEYGADKLHVHGRAQECVDMKLLLLVASIDLFLNFL